MSILRGCLLMITLPCALGIAMAVFGWNSDAPRPTSAPASTLRPGDHAFVHDGTGHPVLVARSRHALYRALEAGRVGDTRGVRAAELAGSLWIESSGTAVLVLSYEGLLEPAFEVRLLSGLREGSSCWLTPDCLRKK